MKARPLFILVLIPAFLSAGTGVVLRTANDLHEAVREKAIGANFDLTAVVTKPPNHNGGSFLFQDETGGFSGFYHATNDISTLVPGNKFRIQGRINLGQSSRKPVADCDSFTFIDDNCFPNPLIIKASDLSTRKTDFRFLRISGTVTDAFNDELDQRCSFIILNSDETLIYLVCPPEFASSNRLQLIGATITADGFGLRNGSHRWLTAKGIELASMNDIQIVRSAPADPFDVPDINSTTFPAANARRADGSVIAIWNQDKILIRNGDRLVKGELSVPPPPYGASITLLGHPETDLFHPMLVRARWRHSETIFPPANDTPVDTTVRQLHAGDVTYRHFTYSFHGKTIRIKGIVHSLPIKGGDDRFFIESDGKLTVVDITACPDAVRGLEIGYEIAVTGTCVMESEKVTLNKTIPRITGFVLAVHNPQDIIVTKRLPWWTTARLIGAIGTLLAGLLAVFIWNLVLHRLVTKRSDDLVDERFHRRENELKVEERTRLSVELHDSISQNITGACLQINAAQDFFETDPRLALRHLGIAAKALGSCRNELKDCIWDLRSQALEKTDMNSAILLTLEPYVRDISTLAVRFNVSRHLFSDNTAHILLRIIRELVTNAIRHGNATTVRIAGCIEDGKVLFSVQDNGSGFDIDTAPGISEGHFGLQGIRERVKDLGGAVTFSQPKGVGTKVTIAFNIPAAGSTEK